MHELWEYQSGKPAAHFRHLGFFSRMRASGASGAQAPSKKVPDGNWPYISLAHHTRWGLLVTACRAAKEHSPATFRLDGTQCEHFGLHSKWRIIYVDSAVALWSLQAAVLPTATTYNACISACEKEGCAGCLRGQAFFRHCAHHVKPRY